MKTVLGSAFRRNFFRSFAFLVFRRRFGQGHQYFYNTVLLDSLYLQVNPALQRDFLVVFGKAVQAFDDQAADGIIVFAVKFQIKLVIVIVNILNAFIQVDSLLQLMDQFFLIFVVLVTDLGHFLLQQIFQGDHAHGGAIFI